MQEDHDECTIAEYAKKYSVNRYTLNKAIEQERLPARKSGGTYLIKQSDFDQWHANHKPLPRKKQSSEEQEIASKKP